MANPRSFYQSTLLVFGAVSGLLLLHISIAEAARFSLKKCEDQFVAVDPFENGWRRPVFLDGTEEGPIRGSWGFQTFESAPVIPNDLQLKVEPQPARPPVDSGQRESGTWVGRHNVQAKAEMHGRFELTGFSHSELFHKKPLKVDVFPLRLRTGELDSRGALTYEVLKVSVYEAGKGGKDRIEVYEVGTGSGFALPGVSERVRKKLAEAPTEPQAVRAETENISGLPFNLDAVVRSVLGHNAREIRFFDEARREILKEGEAKQAAYIDEMLTFVKPEYENRRGWRDDFPGMVKKAYETAGSTRYVFYRHSGGELIATVGATAVGFGKLVAKDLNRGWVEFVGPFGTANHLIKFGAADAAIGERVGYGLAPNPVLWTSPIELLPAEKVIGNGFTFTLRAVPDDSMRLTPRALKHFFRTQKLAFPEGFNIDLDYGLHISHGLRIETVKFVVLKNLERRGLARIDVLISLFEHQIPSGFDINFRKNAVTYGTYNDEVGARDGIGLYTQLGHSVRKDAPPGILGGEPAYAMEATPETVLRSLYRFRPFASPAAQETLDRLMKEYGVTP